MKILRFILFLALSSASWATNAVYIAATAAGGNTGLDCADAKAVSYFNTSGNWSATPTGIQIGPDTTVHLCGTFTGGSAASPALTVQGSGSSGHNVVVQSDSGSPATFTATYWGPSFGAIYCTGQQYITFDGNSSGVIENTAAPHTPSTGQLTEGIEDDCSNTSIKGWTVGPLYVHVAGVSTDCISTGDCPDSEGVSVNNADHVQVTQCTVHDTRVGIGFNLPASSTYSKWEVDHNTIYNIDHGVTLASNATGSSIASILEHDNDISNGSNWDSTFTPGSCDWHHDGTHLFGDGGASDTLNGVQIYNNYIHGLWTVTNTGSGNGCFNAHIYMEDDIVNPEIFNNVLELDSGALNAPDGGYISVRAESNGSGVLMANNTFIINDAATSGPAAALQIVEEANIYDVNQLFWGNNSSNFGYFINFQSDGSGNTTCISFAYCDYNGYWRLTDGYFFYGGNSFINYATGSPNWQGIGLDAHGQFQVNPTLNASAPPYTLQSGSPAIGAAKNLTSLSITALDTSAPDTFGAGGACGTTGCITRPSSGAWDEGAYEFGSSGGQASEPSCTPSSGTVPISVSCTNPNSGTTVMCYNFSGSPATNGDGATCPAGSTIYSTSLLMATSGTLYIVAGTSTLSDSTVLSATFTNPTFGAYAPLAIDVNAPDSTQTSQYDSFILNELPYLSGITGGSTRGEGIGQVFWSDVDNCSSTAPCQTDDICSGGTCFNWAAIDTNLMAYINAPVGANGTFKNGCYGGQKCKIVLIINPVQDQSTSNTVTPNYVFSSTWATNAPGGPYPDQDVSACNDWPGATSSTWPGALAYSGGSFNTNNLNGVVWNAGACTTYCTGAGGTPPACTGAPQCTGTTPYTNMSAFPVVYEKPYLLAYQNFIKAFAIHYSASCTGNGCGNGPTIAPYINYIRFGRSKGGEDNPNCAGTGTVTGGVMAFTLYPGPQGLAAEPQGFTQCGYLTNWAGTAQNGLSCGSGSADGAGYNVVFNQFLASLNWHGIAMDGSSHGGPPSNSAQPYSDSESWTASLNGIGFGMESARVTDPINFAAGQPTQFNYATNFGRFLSYPHHTQGIALSGNESVGSAAQFSITSCTASAGTVTCSCTGNTGGASEGYCAIYSLAPIYIVGNSNPAFNGVQTVTCGTTMNPCSPNNTFQFASSSATTGTGGYVYAGDYWPFLLPFLTQRRANSFELRCQEIDFMLGVTQTSCASSLPWIGNGGPDTSYQQALQNFQMGVPQGTSSCIGKCSIIGNGSIK